MAKNQEMFNQLVDLIAANDPKLISIDLSNQALNPNDIEKLCKALQVNIVVRKLNIALNNIGDFGAKLLSIALYDKQITELNLGLCKISDAGTKDLEPILRNAPLETFNFAGNSITEVGSKIITDAFATHATLLELRLDLCRIGDSLAHQICFLLSKNTVIQSINLSSNNISSAGMHIISQYVAQCRSLKKLYLLNNAKGDFFDNSAFEVCKFYSSSVDVKSADHEHPGMAITRSYDKVRAIGPAEVVVSEIESQLETRKPRLKISY